MTTTNTKNTNFTFRSKFEKLLSDENRTVVTAAFEKFCTMEPDSARDLLWCLTYDENVASAAMGELGLNQEIIHSEHVSAFRNELRSQYEKLHSDFLAVEVPDTCQEAFTALVKHTDVIVANVVFAHCKNRLYVDDYFMNRTLFLLSSAKENNYFGGIRELLFNHEEAVFLKQYHCFIHDLLFALYNDKLEKESSYKNTPFEGLATLIENAGMDLPFDLKESEKATCDEAVQEVPTELPVEKPVQTSSEFKTLTSAEILAHKDVFASFVLNSDLNVLVQIGKFGFDLNEVMAKKDKISNLLKAVEAKEKAEAKLLKATEAKEKAEAKLLKAAEALSK